MGLKAIEDNTILVRLLYYNWGTINTKLENPNKTRPRIYRWNIPYLAMGVITHLSRSLQRLTAEQIVGQTRS